MPAPLGPVGACPEAVIAAAFVACQSSLNSIGVEPENNRIAGSARVPGTPSAAIDGPRPLMITFFDSEPPMMKPPIMMLSPVATRPRVEMFTSRGMAVPVKLGVTLFEAEEAALFPTAFVATTVQVTAVPFVSPLTVIGELVPVPVLVPQVAV